MGKLHEKVGEVMRLESQGLVGTEILLDSNTGAVHALTMDFRDRGFLGSEADGYRAKFRQEYADYFGAAHDANFGAYKLLQSIEKTIDEDLRKITVLSLYLRILNGFAAVVRLLEFGMTQEAGVVLRTLIETAIFAVKAGDAADEAWLKNYVALTKVYELRYLDLNYGKPKDRKCFDSKVSIDLANKIASLKREVKELDLRTIEKSDDFQCAHLGYKLNLHTLIDHGWRMFSNISAHPSSASLERFIEVNSQGYLDAVIHAPNMSEIRLIIPSALTCIVLGMKVLEHTFLGVTSASEAMDAKMTAFTKGLIGK
jgi:hypothetical protein